MNRILFFLLLLIVGSLSAEEEQISPDKRSVLFLLSSEEDLIGEGNIYLYQAGEFSLKTDQNFHFLQFLFREEESTCSCSNWRGFFSPHRGHQLLPGSYRKAKKNQGHNYPGFDFSCGENECETVAGRFEILELKRDEQGEISAAINFLQHCDGKNRPPLFGCIRYRSAIPVEANAIEIFGKYRYPESFLFLKKMDQATGKVKCECKTDRKYFFKSKNYPGESLEDGDNIIVKVVDREGCADYIEFSLSKGISTGFYYHAFDGESIDPLRIWYEKSFQEREESSRLFLEELNLHQGEFKVLHLYKNSKGAIEELAVNFKLKNFEGKILEGTLRYHCPEIPVNFTDPFP